MIAIRFDRAVAEKVLAALRDGGPIEHTGSWSRNDMLALAGACFFAALSHGPTLQPGAAATGMHSEHREASEGTLFADLHGAIEFLSERVMWLADGEYEDRHEPVFEVLLDGEGRSIQPVSGFRDSEAAS